MLNALSAAAAAGITLPEGADGVDGGVAGIAGNGVDEAPIPWWQGYVRPGDELDFAGAVELWAEVLRGVPHLDDRMAHRDGRMDDVAAFFIEVQGRPTDDARCAASTVLRAAWFRSLESEETADELARALRTLDGYKITTPEYLWRPYVQRGELNLLAGNYGDGKTWAALALATHGSRGWPLPDETGKPPNGHVEPWRTVYLTAENDPGVLRFRIERMGGDPSMVTVWDTSVAPLPSLQELGKLEGVLSRVKPALFVVDPLQSVLGRKLDMNKAADTRPVFDGLTALARRHRCATLALLHLNKATTQTARYRMLGSVDIPAAARSILLCARDPGEKSRRVLVHLKASFDREGLAQSFALDGDGDGVAFGWTGTVDLDADQLLGTGEQTRPTKVGGAEAFLRDALKDGPRPRKDLEEEAALKGIEEWHLKRAAKALNVTIRTEGFPRRSVWSL